MNNLTIETSPLADFRVTIILAAQQSRADAIALAKTITTVTTSAQQQDAVSAASLMKGLLRDVEKARKAVKEPVLAAGNAIDSAAKKFAAELETETKRVEGLAAKYQQDVDRALAEEKAAQERQFKALREKEEAALREIAAKAEQERRANLATIAAAADDAAREAAQRKADADAAARSEEVRINQEAVQEQERERLLAAQALVPAKTEGARVVRSWDYTVTDIRLLAFERPDLVTIEPKRAMLLTAAQIPGIVIPGVAFHEVTKVQAKAS